MSKKTQQPSAPDAAPKPAKAASKITRTDNSKNGYVEARRNQRRRART